MRIGANIKNEEKEKMGTIKFKNEAVEANENVKSKEMLLDETQESAVEGNEPEYHDEYNDPAILGKDQDRTDDISYIDPETINGLNLYAYY